MDEKGIEKENVKRGTAGSTGKRPVNLAGDFNALRQSVEKAKRNVEVKPEASKTLKKPVAAKPQGQAVKKPVAAKPQGQAVKQHPAAEKQPATRPRKPVTPAMQRSRKKEAVKRRRAMQLLILEVMVVLVLLVLILFAAGRLRRNRISKVPDVTAVSPEMTVSSVVESVAEEVTVAATGAGEAVADIAFEPHATENTEPSNLIEYTNISYNGEKLDSIADFEPWYNFDFGQGTAYTSQEAVVGFRGNNFRDNPTYGATHMQDDRFKEMWTYETGSTEYNGKVWSGNGWTGQPLIAHWPKAVREKMNMYEDAKQAEELTEVIYASMDGYIYFLNLETGKATRDAMYVGWTFKGAGALDPRGYPIMYVGAGYNSDNGIARVFIINLLDTSVMYTFGNEDSFSLRGTLSFFDSSALVDAASDTLIYPGENGILYLIHLGTQYDMESGTISVDPDKIAKWRYWGTRSSDQQYWLGMEDSAAVYRHYMFVCDNGGNMMCLDLNTLKLVWVKDILDDSNGSPVLSIEDGHLYVYISTSFHLGWRSDEEATIPIWKLDAETGETAWHTDYECWSQESLSGGVQSTIATGKNSLSDYIYVTVSDTGTGGGVCVCLDKKDGTKVWEHEAAYAWSSPVCVYHPDGTGRVIYFSSAGKGYILDGVTGEQIDRLDLGEVTMEASPAVYNGYMVVGSRDNLIYGFDLT